MNVLLIATLTGVAAFCVWMGLLRPADSPFAATSNESLMRSVDIKLKRAGITSITPATLIFALVTAMGALFVALWIATGKPWMGLAAVPLTPIALNVWLERRSRSFHDKLVARLVPFLRKIASQVRTGQNPTRAFATAANEDPLLSFVLRSQLNDLSLQRPFLDVLEDTLTVMPIRQWVQFVRSMQTFAATGGELADILTENVTRINSQILLHQRLMGDVAQYKGQQYIMLAFGVLTPFFLYQIGGDTFGSVLSSVAGWIALALAGGMFYLAFWITNRAIKDVERRLNA